MRPITMYCLGRSIDIPQINATFKKKKALKSTDCFGVAISSLNLKDPNSLTKPIQAFNCKDFSNIQRNKSKQ
jgi:uncharacterized Rmd1/YagE family protein